MQVAAHLSAESVVERMKQSRTLSERLRWQVISLAQSGYTSTQIAPIVGYSGFWVLHLVAL